MAKYQYKTYILKDGSKYPNIIDSVKKTEFLTELTMLAGRKKRLIPIGTYSIADIIFQDKYIKNRRHKQ